MVKRHKLVNGLIYGVTRSDEHALFTGETIVVLASDYDTLATQKSHDVAHATIVGLARQIEMFLVTLTGIVHCDKCQTCRKNAEETLVAYRSQRKETQSRDVHCW